MSRNYLGESEMRDYFSLFDTKGDGKIAKGDFGTVSRSLGANPTNKEISTLTSNSGKDRLSFEDFYPMWQSVIKMEEERADTYGQDKIVSGFRAFDREGNGQITISDVQNILEKLGERLSGEESGAILGQFVDSEGRIEYEKMVNTILNDDSRP
ncbi:myosin-2 essential light chain-like [Symsagittifera roscoffensis]|uniref:myosin-2 essential light chain-like n=1 Tax=Symsagittifera roscoffensis TaxID=84072 RepID=UPI00307C7906